MNGLKIAVIDDSLDYLSFAKQVLPEIHVYTTRDIPNGYDLVICDYQMGFEEITPKGKKVVYVTTGGREGIKTKPFNKAKMMELINEELD